MAIEYAQKCMLRNTLSVSGYTILGISPMQHASDQAVYWGHITEGLFERVYNAIDGI